MEYFSLKKEHIDLLGEAYISWNDCEFGASEINPKRPYGDSDVCNSIGKILNVEGTEEGGHYSFPQIDFFCELHKQTQIALHLILKYKSFKLRSFKRKNSYDEWEPYNG